MSINAVGEIARYQMRIDPLLSVAVDETVKSEALWEKDYWIKAADHDQVVAALTREREALQQKHERLAAALWAAVDVIRERVGPFASWSEQLKDAFSKAIIDPSPPTEADIARTLELAERYGWTRS